MDERQQEDESDARRKVIFSNTSGEHEVLARATTYKSFLPTRIHVFILNIATRNPL